MIGLAPAHDGKETLDIPKADCHVGQLASGVREAFYHIGTKIAIARIVLDTPRFGFCVHGVQRFDERCCGLRSTAFACTELAPDVQYTLSRIRWWPPRTQRSVVAQCCLHAKRLEDRGICFQLTNLAEQPLVPQLFITHGFLELRDPSLQPL